MVDSTLPKSLQRIYPPVVLAQRMPMRRADGTLDSTRSSWLVVQYDSEWERSEGYGVLKGVARVSWFPRASFFNCKPARMGEYWGPDALDRALACAAREESSGPDSSVCARAPVKSEIPRDMQRERVYRWERAKGFTKEPLIEDLQEVKAFAQSVAVALGSRGSLTVKWNTGGGGSHANSGGIAMAKCQATRSIICHEVAHTVAGRCYGNGNIQGHGPEFMALYLAALALTCKPGQHGFLVASAKLAGLKVKEAPERVAARIKESESKESA